MAMPSAFVTNDAVCDASIAQPTTRRENVSNTTAQYTLPSRVGCSVMSVTQSWSGCRLKRRGADGSSVVHLDGPSAVGDDRSGLFVRATRRVRENSRTTALCDCP